VSESRDMFLCLRVQRVGAVSSHVASMSLFGGTRAARMDTGGEVEHWRQRKWYSTQVAFENMFSGCSQNAFGHVG
jgi:hypothetical protein